MSIEEELTWVQRNRARRPSERQAGQVMETLVVRECTDAFERCGELARALAGYVDDDFRRHCRLAGVSRGVLTINVDEPSLLYAMRMRWEGVLGDAVRRCGRRGVIGRVVFEYGGTGMRVPVRPACSTGPMGRYG
ncbi:MAG: DUF721 domain-containing protein [Phycisphaerales bacterium]|nr:MAG: DUF721 domain-containing protein [Phycisphaerales bacterium]